MAASRTMLARMTYHDVKAIRFEIALLPWGATEAHNLHLPYGTDILETEQIAAESARLAADQGVLCTVLPAIPFGVNTGQMDIPLTINVNPSTQMALLEDVASSMDAHGIPKLVLFNGHGGNDFRQMIRELQGRHKTFLCAVDWFRSVEREEFFSEPGDHADELETSLMMHLAPDLVRPLAEAGPGKAKKFRIRAFREGWAWTPRRWSMVTADTGAGDPRGATREKGERYFRAVTRTIAGFLVDLAAADINDMYE